jgi:Short C-terminal domain
MDNGITTAIVCGVPVLIFAAVLIIIGNSNVKEVERKKKALEAARKAYQESLAKLKAAPNDADVKQRTLELGRYYSALTRQDKNVTVYDEVALGNDINAATAGASAQAAPTAASVEDRLKTLDDLRSKGMISDAEYTARRQKILETL